MKYKICAFLTDGQSIFEALTYYLPRKGEEIMWSGRVFIVDNVRYIIDAGASSITLVQLSLKMVE